MTRNSEEEKKEKQNCLCDDTNPYTDSMGNCWKKQMTEHKMCERKSKNWYTERTNTKNQYFLQQPNRRRGFSNEKISASKIFFFLLSLARVIAVLELCVVCLTHLIFACALQKYFRKISNLNFAQTLFELLQLDFISSKMNKIGNKIKTKNGRPPKLGHYPHRYRVTLWKWRRQEFSNIDFDRWLCLYMPVLEIV